MDKIFDNLLECLTLLGLEDSVCNDGLCMSQRLLAFLHDPEVLAFVNDRPLTQQESLHILNRRDSSTVDANGWKHVLDTIVTDD
jgi:hypothetical protein